MMASTAIHQVQVPVTLQIPVNKTDAFINATNSVAAYEPRDVVSTFNYFKDTDDGLPPKQTDLSKPETLRRPIARQTQTVYDARGSEELYRLDIHGFQWWRHVSKEKNFEDDDQIKREYYPEIEKLLKEVTTASRIKIFAHTVRRQTSNTQVQDNRPLYARGPTFGVHVDQSYKGAAEHLERFITDDPNAPQHRYQIINVWRPIKTIRKDPFAVSDARTISEDDLVQITVKAGQFLSNSWHVRPNEKHRFYYLNEQTPEEVLMIKCFDSKLDGRARRCPHSAFRDEEREDEESRESVEVRCLLMYADDTAE